MDNSNLDDVSEALARVGQLVSDVVIPTFQRMVDIVANFTNEVLDNPSYRRVRHLAFHAKKARVRKKNINRITKQVQRNIKRMVKENADSKAD